MRNELSDSPVVLEFPIPRAFETDGEKLSRLELENKQLVEELAIERVMRRDAEERADRLQKQITELENAPRRKRRTKAEMEAEAPKPFSEFKSDGKRKPRPADPIRSYEDFAAVQNYFLENGKIRDWALWTIGVSLGLRISDLLSLKISYLLNDDKTFRKRMHIVEQKTLKINNCLITQSVIDAATKLFDSMNWDFELDD
jgi:integrase